MHVQAQDGRPTGYAMVRHCTWHDAAFVVGLELDEETRKTNSRPPEDTADYYEFLQISPRAEAETINRIYRFLAGRFHPDNPQTGDPERFVLLNQAFDVLSDPQRRAEYDASLEGKDGQPLPAFATVDFMDGAEGEVNRRMAVLSLLYRRCRANIEDPKVSLAELEAQMGFPREYLDFTTWYRATRNTSPGRATRLRSDRPRSRLRGSELFKLPILRKLLNAGVEATRKTPSASPDPQDVYLPEGMTDSNADPEDQDDQVGNNSFKPPGNLQE